MSVTAEETGVDEHEAAPAAAPLDAPDGQPDGADRTARRLAPLLMLVAVAIGAAMPLVENHIFYYWDDSAAAATGVWRRMGEAVLQGRLPLLELDMWRGGNFAAEAATGIWNPVVLVLAAGTHWINNMALALAVVKGTFLAIMALGAYLLAREYGARPWPAAAIGAALPLAGYTLFMDSVAWINALLVTAFMPYVWWTVRRYVRGRGSAFWIVVAGYLCVSVGNPYALLGVGVCFLAVLVETWLAHDRARIMGLVLSGGAILLMSVIVYLPFLLTAKVGFRAGSTTENNEFLSPSLTDLLGMSSPSMQPWIEVWGYPYFTVPVMYAAWFLLPLLPWLRWPARAEWRARWRPMAGLLVFAAVFLVMVLGPSQIWMFRWPLRLLPFLILPLMIVFAVLVSDGLDRTRARFKLVLSVGIVLMGGYVAWSDLTQPAARHTVATLAVLALLLVALRIGLAGVRGFAVLAGGTLLVLGLQLSWFPGNYNVDAYRFPTGERLLEDRFADRYQGMTVQIADLGKVPAGRALPDGAYRDMLFGSMYSVAGVETTSAYSGVGFTALDSKLYLYFQGGVYSSDAWAALWRAPDGADAPLADLLRAQTVVTQHTLIDTRTRRAPEGWTKAEVTDQVVVWRRVEPLPWPDGRVSDTAGVDVVSDRRVGRSGEAVTFQRAADADGPASLTFARLAWPGYSASLDGRDLPVRQGPAGLLVVDVPADAANGEIELSWRPPGLAPAVVAFVAGLLLAGAIGLAPWLRRRRAAADQEVVEPAASLDKGKKS